MLIAKDLESLQKAVAELAQAGKTIALVPTMGALHAGHAKLIKTATQNADAVVVSIFVNPKQFGPNEDFLNYPRTFEADKLIAKSAGADIIYAPSPDDLYSEGFSTSISLGSIENRLCGKVRPGHFNGVAIVVTKLLLRIMPHIAVFGEKDYQQLCIIEKLVDELDIAVEILPVETVREDDGLAMSSRNKYLTEEERLTAPLLYKTLKQTVRDIDSYGVVKALTKGIEDLKAYGFKVDYLEFCDSYTLEPLSDKTEGARLLVAAWLGKTRLIDNIEV